MEVWKSNHTGMPFFMACFLLSMIFLINVYFCCISYNLGKRAINKYMYVKYEKSINYMYYEI